MKRCVPIDPVSSLRAQSSKWRQDENICFDATTTIYVALCEILHPSFPPLLCGLCDYLSNVSLSSSYQVLDTSAVPRLAIWMAEVGCYT